MAYLSIIRGEDRGRVFELTGGRTVIGRHPQCEIVLGGNSVSRHHAQLLESHETYFIEDLSSRNGTFLNGECLEGRTELRPGDQIKLCDFVLEFHTRLEDSSAAKVAPAVSNKDDLGEVPRSTTSLASMDESHLYVPAPSEEEETPNFDTSSVLSRLSVSQSGEYLLTAKPEAKLQAVMEISRALAAELEVDNVLPKILASLFKVFPQAEQGFILLKSPNSDKLRIKATRSRSDAQSDAVAVSMTVVRQAMQTCEAILSENVLDDSRFKSSRSLNELQIRSMMCVPFLGSNGAALGVMQLDTRSLKQAFTQDDLELFLSVASQAALAIENAQLHEEALHKRELDRDLEFATQVQLGFLPKARPSISGYRFADYYEAALRVGGDYFDYVELPDGRMAITVGDVAGKGMPAALLMARLYSSARYHLLTAADAADSVNRLNADIAGSGLGHRFITFLLMVLDVGSHQITLVNAGHLPPILKTGKTVEAVGRHSASLPLGIIPNQQYTSEVVELEPESTLLAFTDGVTEAMNESKEIFGRVRLEQCVAESEPTIESMIQAVVAAVDTFSDGGPDRDDTCLVGLARTSVSATRSPRQNGDDQ